MNEATHEEAVLLWSDILDMAKEELEPAIIPWLERLSPLDLTDGVLTMAARQKWTEKKVMTEYRQSIEAFIKTITLEDITLNVVVDPELFRDVPGAGEQANAPQPSYTGAGAAPSQPSYEAQPAAATSAYVAAMTAPLPAYSPIETAAAPLEAPLVDAVVETPATLEETLTREGARVLVDTTGSVEVRQEEQGGAFEIATPQRVAREALSGFTFDTFVVGEANKMAFEAARNVAEDPNAVFDFNPLFLYSKSGLGKTHLLMAIKNYIDLNRPSIHAVYSTSSNFIADYVDDIQNKRLKGTEVMKKYYEADVLLVDDVQMFTRNQQSVSAFFDIFNQLTLHGKQIVLAADEPPDYLNLDDRVRTRFGAGMVLDIAEPSYDLRRQILANFYHKQQRNISWFHASLTEDNLDYIAEIAPSSIREMQGFLMKISTMSSARHGLTRGQIKAIRDELFRNDKPIDIGTVIRVVAIERGIEEDEIKGKKQTKAVSRARQECMWLARQLTDESYQAIGSWFNRDHSTVYNSISKIDTIAKSDRTYQLELEDLKKVIRNR